jgi:hypothetical protein
MAAAALLLLTTGVAAAGHGGGGHGGGGGFHGGGGSRGGGGSPGFSRGGQGQYARGGYHGGHGGYGGYGGYRGYGGAYHGRGYGGWRGWWGGVGLGLYLSALPWDYETLWWGTTPFYYADDNYYVWDGDAGAYQAVEPPAGLRSSGGAGAPGSSAAPAVDGQLFVYPRAGQAEALVARDRDECSRWATTQTGASGAVTTAGGGQPSSATRPEYLRAEAACLEGRNYTVR